MRELWISCQLNLFFSVMETGNNRLHRLGHSWPLCGRSWSLHGRPGEGLSLGPQSLLLLTRPHSVIPGASRTVGWHWTCSNGCLLACQIPDCSIFPGLWPRPPLAGSTEGNEQAKEVGGSGGSGCGGESSVAMPRVSIARRGSSTAAAPGPVFRGAGQALSGPRLMGET